MSEPIVPQTQTSAESLHIKDSLRLDPAPYAVEVFTDLERGKQLITLHFRRQDTRRALAEKLKEDVQAELKRVGLVLREPVKHHVRGASSKTRFTGYLEAALKAGGEEDTSLEALRHRYGKP